MHHIQIISSQTQTPGAGLGLLGQLSGAMVIISIALILVKNQKPVIDFFILPGTQSINTKAKLI